VLEVQPSDFTRLTSFGQACSDVEPLIVSDKFLGIVRLKFNLDNLETLAEPVTLQLAPPQSGANSASIASYVGEAPLGSDTKIYSLTGRL
jgi:hypothetical protein